MEILLRAFHRLDNNSIHLSLRSKKVLLILITRIYSFLIVAFLSYRRKLEEGSAEIPKAFSDKEMKIEIERDLSDPSSNVTPSSNLEFDQLR